MSGMVPSRNGIYRHGNSKFKKALFSKDRRCHWCGVVTIKSKEAGWPRDPRMATLDHVKERRDCATQEEYGSPDNHVLGCLGCNSMRAKESNLKRCYKLDAPK